MLKGEILGGTLVLQTGQGAEAESDGARGGRRASGIRCNEAELT